MNQLFSGLGVKKNEEDIFFIGMRLGVIVYFFFDV